MVSLKSFQRSLDREIKRQAKLAQQQAKALQTEAVQGTEREDVDKI